ncbi:MAG TPA: hypothetical protein VF747_12550 [Blastocatellia bacterium]
MSETVSLAAQPIEPGGDLSFLQITEDDIERLGLWVQALADTVRRFILRRGEPDDVLFGANVVTTGGLTFDVYKPVLMFRGLDGKHFEHFDLAPQSFTAPVPDATNPRIDRIYARWEEEADGVTELRHVKVLPTDAFSAEDDINAVVTKRNKLTLLYLQGTAAANPVAPHLPSDSVEVYQVYVPANAVELTTASFRDERHNFLPLEEVNEQVTLIWEIINNLRLNKHRHPADAIDIDQAQLDPSKQGKWITSQDMANDLSRAKGGGGDPAPNKGTIKVRPEILRPDVLKSDVNAGKLGATGLLDEGNAPAVKYKHPRQVDFNGTLRTLAPNAYIDVALNARFRNESVNAANEYRALTTANTPGTVVVEQTNGGGIYELQNYASPEYVSHGVTGRRLITPRSATVIDLFGVGDSSGAPRSIWLELDTVAGTFTQRAILGDIPQYGISFAVSLGNGKALIAGPGGSSIQQDQGRIKWFLLDTATRVSTAIAGGPGDVTTSLIGEFNIMGDLIISGPNGVVMLIVWGEGITAPLNVGMFKYHVNSNTFTAVQPVGEGPNWARNEPKLQHMDACVYQNGELFAYDALQGPGRAYIFNQASDSWRPLNISLPSQATSALSGAFLFGASVANVNGRIHLASGSSKIWELVSGTTSVWSEMRVPAMEDQNGASRWGACMTGMLKDGLPTGTGYLIGGSPSTGSLFVDYLKQVWRFAAGGVIGSQCGGAAGLTLAEGASSATVRVADTGPGFLPWAVDSYNLTVQGTWQPGQVKAMVSFDGGVHKFDVSPGDTISVAPNSDNAPIRQLWLILTGTAANKPCISAINEVFEDQAGPGLEELFVIFNPPVGTWYLYCDRDTGYVTLENTPQETTASKCYLAKIVRVGNNAPSVLNIINEPFTHRLYRIADNVGVIENDFCVAPHFIAAKKIDSNGFYKDINAPAAPFNGNIDTSALTAATEIAVVELEA